MPKTSSVDAATAAITDLLTVIRNPAPASPFAGIETEKLSALDTLTTIFQTPDEPYHEQSTDEPAPITVQSVPATLPRVGTPPETDTNTPYLDMTRDPVQWCRKQAAKQKTKTIQTPVIANSSKLLRSGVPKCDARNKQCNPLVNPVLTHHSTTTINNTDHYATHLPPLTTQQPTQHAQADNIHPTKPITNAILHLIMGAPQPFLEIINDPATQKKYD